MFVFCVIRKLSEENLLIFTIYWILILDMTLPMFFSHEGMFKPHWVYILGASVTFNNVIFQSVLQALMYIFVVEPHEMEK